MERTKFIDFQKISAKFIPNKTNLRHNKPSKVKHGTKVYNRFGCLLFRFSLFTLLKLNNIFCKKSIKSRNTKEKLSFKVDDLRRDPAFIVKCKRKISITFQCFNSLFSFTTRAMAVLQQKAKTPLNNPYSMEVWAPVNDIWRFRYRVARNKAWTLKIIG